MSVLIHSIYEGKLKCVATHEPSQMTLITDAPVDNGGTGSAFSPTDLVATALGTCVMTTMGLVAARHQIDLTGMTVRVTKEMTQSPVRRIASLVTEVTVPARAVTDVSMRDRLEAAAAKCPVHASLHPDVNAPIQFIYQ
jgi:putative redox protein